VEYFIVQDFFNLQLHTNFKHNLLFLIVEKYI
jgi:hypothetical protein